MDRSISSSRLSSWWNPQLMYSFVLLVGQLQLLGHWHQLWSYAQAAKSSKPRSKGCFCDHEHVRSLLKALYWLPVKDRIIFKIATSVFHFFDGIWPPYLSSCLSSSHVCSSSDEFVVVVCNVLCFALWASHMYSLRGIQHIRNAFIIIIKKAEVHILVWLNTKNGKLWRGRELLAVPCCSSQQCIPSQCPVWSQTWMNEWIKIYI